MWSWMYAILYNECLPHISFYALQEPNLKMTIQFLDLHSNLPPIAENVF